MTVVRDVIRVEDQFYIHAVAAQADEHLRVLKAGDLFALFDQSGNMRRLGMGEQGLYFHGTRFLSRLMLRLNGTRPALLSSTVVDETALLAVDLSNPDLEPPGEEPVPRGTVHVFRSNFLLDHESHERLRVRNYGDRPLDLEFSYEFDADFRDIFEVRGTKRARRGHRSDPVPGDREVTIDYVGLDRVRRTTRLSFDPAPAALRPHEAVFRMTLAPHEETNVYVTISCEVEALPAPRRSHLEATGEARRRTREAESCACWIRSSHPRFDAWLNRSLSDLRMMVTDTPHGPYPYAGVPWYSTPFGRDGIITALQLVWVWPQVARGVLRFLAATQAHHQDDARDSEPGKILHEMREGEMAAVGEIPFGRYYGTIDATPLFVMLAGSYWDATADRTTIEQLWPHIERALEWIDRHGDQDGDGFVEYARRRATGLLNQGWKDSTDSVFHADGRLADGPIALCEVQAYVYGARRAAAHLSRALGDAGRAARLDEQAERLRESFERTYWLDDLSTYALALDGQKAPCRVRTSNAGHCLFTGIAAADRALRTARTLMDPASFSGWGVRTAAEGELRYNPMSYHDGSIWPHDNALIALGMARYGLKDEVLRLLTAQFDAARYFELHRMPELFCGFPRRESEGPTLYPVACSPQAWASGTAPMLLQACLGLQPCAPERTLRFVTPTLPPYLDRLDLEGLQVGDATVDLRIHRYASGAGVSVLRRSGPLEVVVVS